VRDVNYGYYRNKARWMGADFKTSGTLNESTHRIQYGNDVVQWHHYFERQRY